MKRESLFYKKSTIVCNGQLLDLSTPKIMAIINCTPDSFYDGGKLNTEKEIEKHTITCIEQGTDIIDIGAYSSRPGAIDIDEKEEIRRLEKALHIVRPIAPNHIISIDTFRSNVARQMIKKFNINMINDISGGQLDNSITDIAAEYGLPYILMHIKGKPQNMQKNPTYQDIFSEVMTYFAFKIDELNKKGIHDVIIDPGFGFGKTMEHNYELMSQLQDLITLECPVLVGVSRKSMIYKRFNTTPDEALNGTTALHMAALQKGANILRVHDVNEAKQVINLYKAIS